MKNVFITVVGGCIQNVTSEEPLNVVIIDYDEFEGTPPEEWNSDIRTQGLFIMDSDVLSPGKKFTEEMKEEKAEHGEFDEDEQIIYNALVAQGL